MLTAKEELQGRLSDMFYHSSIANNSELVYAVMDLFNEMWTIAKAESKQETLDNVDLICYRARQYGMTSGGA
jgi:hypothetical protein